MPRRNPNRRRKSSRKTRAQEPRLDQADYYQQYHNTMYANGDVLAAARFSEDSIRRQLGCTIPLPHQPHHTAMQRGSGMCYGTHGDRNSESSGMATPRWQTGCRYTYTHPVTHEHVVLWLGGGHETLKNGYAYEHAGEEEYYHNEDNTIGPGTCGEELTTCCQDTQKSAEPPLFGYREGYHDPVLKDMTEDWWRLFGDDVPKQFILGAESTSKVGEEWNVAAYFAPCRTPGMVSCSKSEKECRFRKENAFKKGEKSEKESSTGEIGSGIQRVCRGRDDWECDFCGIECFCWTVEASLTEV